LKPIFPPFFLTFVRRERTLPGVMGMNPWKSRGLKAVLISRSLVHFPSVPKK
jgi:hypothetical protein